MRLEDLIEKGSASSEANVLFEEAKQFDLAVVMIVGIRKDGSCYLSSTLPERAALEYLLKVGQQGIDVLVAKNH